MAVEDARCQVLVDAERADGRYVLYWMQAAQRSEHNPALEFAIETANDAEVPLVVAATVIPDYPGTSLRHSAFMLGGLVRALRAVESRGARACLRVGDPVEVIGELAADAVEVVFDRGYLRHQRRWYDELTDRIDQRVTQVEGEVVVPTTVVTDEHEHAARTIRPKIQRHLDDFLVDLPTTALDVTTTPTGTTSDLDLDLEDDGIVGVLREHGVDDSVPVIDWLTPGTDAARARLRSFFDARSSSDSYDDARNRFTDDASTSIMSPYLHYGQISPVAIALAAREHLDDADAFIEELVVRRELAVNHVLHEPDYDSFSSLPDWAKQTLRDHADDERDHVYTSTELERAETDDEVWNAIMSEMRERGWVHNQLRMYWGKQIVRWTNTPEHAFRTLLELNDRYFVDGRDPNSYAGVAWCFGLHDQGFQERDVSGKVRPFTTAALERKDDLRGWLEERNG